jgi:hypothetical protein
VAASPTFIRIGVDGIDGLKNWENDPRADAAGGIGR